MDDRKWSKIPELQCDVLYLDLEDSVPVDQKEQARERITEAISDPSFAAGRELVCRPNNLRTPWGAADVEALAAAGADWIVYPKARSRAEIEELHARLGDAGASTAIMVLVESPEAVVNLQEIAAARGVTSIEFGPFDLAAELGASLFVGDEPFRDALLYARSKCLVVARALGLEAVEAISVANLRSLDAVRAAAEHSRRMGFTGMVTFYPPHVPVINEIMTPSAAEVDWARTVVDAYAAAALDGRGATSVDGRPITAVDVRAAHRILAAC